MSLGGRGEVIKKRTRWVSNADVIMIKAAKSKGKTESFDFIKSCKEKKYH